MLQHQEHQHQEHRARRLAAVVAVPVAVLALAGCGGGSSGATTAAATSAPTNRARFGNSAEFQKIQQCLTAAGISLPTPSGGFRTGTRPSGVPSSRPSGVRPSGGFRGGGMFDNPQVMAALKACGITIPTGGAGGPGSGQGVPNGAPTGAPAP